MDLHPSSKGLGVHNAFLLRGGLTPSQSISSLAFEWKVTTLWWWSPHETSHFGGTGTLLCSSQPNLSLPGTVSSHLRWCNEQIAGWTWLQVLRCLQLGCSFPCFPKFPKASFSCLFLFTFLRSTLLGVWFGLLAVFLGKNHGGAGAGCPHDAVSWKFPWLEMAPCFSKASSQPSSTKQPGVFFSVSRFLVVDSCKI